MKKILFLLPGLAAVLLLGGCATKPRAVPTAFWETPVPVTIVATQLPSRGDFVMQGNQGLLDVAIAAIVTAEVRGATKRLSAASFPQVKDEFAAALREAGFEPHVHPAAVDLDRLPARPDDDDFPRHLGSITKQTGTRYVLVLELLNYGALRTYYAFMPTSAPSGFAAIRGRLVDTKDHKVIWDTGNSVLDCVVQEPVAGEWKEPPDYPNLMASAQRALDRSRQFLLDRFFETRPAATPAATPMGSTATN